jgi:L-cystine uptake protein TcyP (sodium:dicarboxylate symporter family)
MKRSRIVLRLLFLVLVPVAGLAGLLVAGDGYDAAFLVLASLPLVLGVISVLMRKSLG